MKEEKMNFKLTKVPSIEFKARIKRKQSSSTYLLANTEVIPATTQQQLDPKLKKSTTGTQPKNKQILQKMSLLENTKKSSIQQIKRIPPSLSEFPSTKFVKNYKAHIGGLTDEKSLNQPLNLVSTGASQREVQSQHRRSQGPQIHLEESSDPEFSTFFGRRHIAQSSPLNKAGALSKTNPVSHTPQPFGNSQKYAQQGVDQRIQSMLSGGYGVEKNQERQQLLDQSFGQDRKQFLLYQNTALSYKSEQNQAKYLRQMADNQTRLLNKLVHKGDNNGTEQVLDPKSKSQLQLQKQSANTNLKQLSNNEGVLKAKAKVVNIMRTNTGWISGNRHSSNTRASHRSNTKPNSLVINQPPVLIHRKQVSSHTYQSKFDIDNNYAQRLPKIPGSPLEKITKSAISAVSGIRSTSQPRQVQLPASYSDPTGAPYLLFTTNLSQELESMAQQNGEKYSQNCNTMSPLFKTQKDQSDITVTNTTNLPPKNPKRTNALGNRRNELVQRIAKIYEEPRPKIVSSRKSKKQPQKSHRAGEQKQDGGVKLDPSLRKFHQNLKQIDDKFSKLKASLDFFSKVTQSTKRQMQLTAKSSYSDQNSLETTSKRSHTMSQNSLMTVKVDEF